MKILWIVNIILPPVCKQLNLPFSLSGGWLYSSLQTLQKDSSNIEFAVATVYQGEELKKVTIDNIIYYLLPLKGDSTKYHKELEPLWQKVNADFTPDLVHIHGTEYPQALAFLKACPNVKSIVSIQGLISVISKYYLAGISSKEILSSITFRDIVKGTIRKDQKLFFKRGLIEKEILKRTQHIIGRTSWDKAQTWAINPNAQYHNCNETLRPVFYTKQWSYENCVPHTIFVSQANYPIKGLHQVLKAMPLILKHYPDTKIYIAGDNIIRSTSLTEKLRFPGYASFLKQLIKKYRLQDNVIFTGPLTEDEMCSQYLKSNIFICPSSIENSPNSLGEALLLGVPSVASFAGGIPDMMKGKEEYLYRFEEIEMLARKVCDIFANAYAPSDFVELQKNAQKRHDKENNASTLINIYKNIN